MVARRSLRPLLAVVICSIFVLVVAPGSAEAHTELDYSLPTDGASVGLPVDEITVAFTSPVSLVGNGFAVLDPQNNELEPSAVTADDIVFRLQFDPPLAGGTVAVRYEVRAEDGHILDGNFVFVVDAPAPTTAPTTTPTSTPTSTPPTSGAIAPATDAPTTTDVETAPPPTESVATVPDGTTDVTEDAIDDATDEGGSGSGVVIAVVVAAALAAGGFLLVRSRTAA